MTQRVLLPSTIFNALPVSRTLWIRAAAIALGLLFSWPGQFATLGYAASVLLILGALLCPIRLIPVFLLLMFLGPDIVVDDFEASKGVERVVGSPWRVGIGPLTPGMLHAGLYLIVLIRLRASRLVPETRPYVTYAMFAGALGMTVSIMKDGGLSVPYSTVISDIRTVLMLALSVAVWRAIFRAHRGQAQLYVHHLYWFIVVRMFVDLAVWLAGVGPMNSRVGRASIDSTKWTVLVAAFYGLYELSRGRGVPRHLAQVMLSLALLFVYMTRENYITCVIGIVLLFVAGSRIRFALLSVPALCAVTVLGIWAFGKFWPDSFRVYRARVEMLSALMRFDMAAADPRRFDETINCASDLAHDGTIIAGRGFGGYYTDSAVPMGYNVIGAFEPWSAETRRFPRVHHVVGHLTLKFGVIGAALWVILWVKLSAVLWRSRGCHPQWEPVRVVLAAMIPTIALSSYWSTKGLILAGLFVALVDHIRCQRLHGAASTRSTLIGAPSVCWSGLSS